MKQVFLSKESGGVCLSVSVNSEDEPLTIEYGNLIRNYEEAAVVLDLAWALAKEFGCSVFLISYDEFSRPVISIDAHGQYVLHSENFSEGWFD